MGRQDAFYGEDPTQLRAPTSRTHPQAQAAWPPSSAKYKHTLQAFASIYRNEGFRAFYKGLLPSLMGVSHVAVQFPLYEKAKQWAGGYERSVRRQRLTCRSRWRSFFPDTINHPHVQRILENGGISHYLPARGSPDAIANTQGKYRPTLRDVDFSNGVGFQNNHPDRL